MAPRTMNPKLSLVAEEVGTVADRSFDRRHARKKRAKGPASSKEKKEDAISSIASRLTQMNPTGSKKSV